MDRLIIFVSLKNNSSFSLIVENAMPYIFLSINCVAKYLVHLVSRVNEET